MANLARNPRDFLRDTNFVPRLRTGRQLAADLARRPDQWKLVPRTIRMRRARPLDVRLPWLAFDAIDWLDRTLTSTSKVFEYGGGGSTAFFADRVGQVVSVEHDQAWVEALRDSFAAEQNVKVIAESAVNNYQSYVERIAQFPKNYFDLIVIDGRERVRCLKNSRSSVKPGGFVMLDDSQRDRYAAAHSFMSDWQAVTFTGLAPFKFDFGHTTFWRRPLIK